MNQTTEAPKASPVAKFRPVEAQLAKLREQFEGVTFDVSTTTGLKDAKKVKSKLVKYRTSLETKRKELKEPLLEKGRTIDAEAKRIKAELVKLEDPIAKQIKKEEDRLAEIKAAEERKEQERIDGIKERIADITKHATVAIGTSAATIKQSIDDVQDVDIDDSFGEFAEQATDAKAMTLNQLRNLHQTAKQNEKDRAELETLRREKAERDAQEAKERKAKEDIKAAMESKAASGSSNAPDDAGDVDPAEAVNEESQYPAGYPGTQEIVDTVAVRYGKSAKVFICVAADEIRA